MEGARGSTQYRDWSQDKGLLPAPHDQTFPTGTGRRPSLSAQPGPRVPEGGNVTLQCRSAVSSDTFHLSKDGSAAVLLGHHLQDPAAPSQANFTLRAFSLAQSGTYRCYSSNSTAPHLLSLPSEPLELLVSGEAPQPSVVLDSSSGQPEAAWAACLKGGAQRVEEGKTSQAPPHPAMPLIP